MKYIKVYEHYTYYSQISSHEFHHTLNLEEDGETIYNKPSVFSEKELEQIKKYYPRISKPKRNNIIIHTMKEIDQIKKGIPTGKKEDVHLETHVYKMEDEWYMVYYCDSVLYDCPDVENFNEWYESHEKYFKCDQFEGLMVCLKDLGI